MRYALLFVLLVNWYVCNAQRSDPSIEFYFSKNNISGSFVLKSKTKILKAGLFVNKITFREINQPIFSVDIYPENFQLISFTFRKDTLKLPLKIKVDLIEKVIMLDEITITSKRQRFSKNGDTLLVDLNGLEYKPQVDASGIFDELPGFFSDENGTYRVFGKNIEWVTIDGKRIFGGDPSMTLSNLKAEMVERLELVEKKGNGAKYAMNIRLKKDRKKGIFGQIGVGKGYKNLNDDELKATSLFKQGLTVGFVKQINTNNFSSKPLLDNNITQEFYEKYTFFGWDKKRSEGSDFFDEDESSVGGVLQKKDLGFTTSIDNKSIKQHISYQLNHSNNLFNSENFGESFLESRSVYSFNSSKGNKSSNDNKFKYDISFGKKIFSFLSFEADRKTNDMNQEDSLLVKDLSTISSKFFRSSKKNDDKINVEFGLSFPHENKKVKTVIYSNLKLNDGSINNDNSNLNFYSKISQVNNRFYLEGSQSYILSKKVLIEQRPSLSFVYGSSKRFGYFSTSTKNQQLIYKLDNFFYYQAGLFLLNANVSAIRYQSTINTSNLVLDQISLKFPRSRLFSNLNFTFKNNFVFPSMQDLIIQEDLTNQFIQNKKNSFLSPYFRKSIDISYSELNIDKLSLTTTLSFDKTDNSIQNSTELNKENVFILQKLNIKNSLFGFNHVINLASKGISNRHLDFNVNNLFDFRNSIYMFNDEEITGNSLQNQFTLSINYKPKKSLNFKNNLQFSTFRFNGNFNNQINLNSKIFITLNKKSYLNINHKLFYGKDINFQPIVNVEVQRFLLKENKMSFELKALNVFNISEFRINNLTQNQNYSSTNLQQPRMFVLKVSYFPTFWRK